MVELSPAERAEHAAQLVAAGRLTRQEIAESVGISRSTLYRMAKAPAFWARIAQIWDDYRKELMRARRRPHRRRTAGRFPRVQGEAGMSARVGTVEEQRENDGAARGRSGEEQAIGSGERCQLAVGKSRCPGHRPNLDRSIRFRRTQGRSDANSLLVFVKGLPHARDPRAT